MRRICLVLACLSMLSGCGAPGPSAPAPAVAAPAFPDQWYSFAEASEVGPYTAVNIYETEHQRSGRLVLNDGHALALRPTPPNPGDDFAFVVPALGVSFAATRRPGGELEGRWINADGEAAPVTLKPDAYEPQDADQFAILPDGRRMHMLCEGMGVPVVLLDYGAGGTMKKDWGELVGKIAAKAGTRVCAYDRAGRGLSDPAAMPRDAAAVAADIDAMLTAATVPPPYVLVGHSLGSYHVRQYANTYTDKVAGLVLVDPSGDGQLERFDGVIPKMREMQEAMRKVQDDLDCIGKLSAKPVPPDDPLAQQCGGNDPVALAATRSEVEEMPGASTRQLRASRRPYGPMPLIVLTRTDYETGMPPEFTAEDRQAMRLVWELMHADMAALSNKSQQRLVDGAGHYIQRDAPDAVIQAVADVVAEARDMAR